MTGARRVAAALATLGVLAAPSTATGAYAPTAELAFDTYAPAVPPAVTSTMRQAAGEDPTRTIAARFPFGFTYNPALAVAGCGAADEMAATCPESSRLGTANVESPLGRAVGSVHLTTDFRLFVPLRALNGAYTQRVVGTIRALDDGSAEISFDNLPAVPVTESRIALQGGSRSIFVTPRDCGRYTVTTRFVSHAGAEVRRDLPVDISGCPVTPRIEALSVAPRRLRTGRRARVTWRLSTRARRTDVRLYRARRGLWRQVGGVRGPAAGGRNSLRIGPRFGGRRLRPGRHRLVLRAIGDRAVSRARAVGFVVRDG